MTLSEPTPTPAKPSSEAITALVVSIVGFATCCGFVLSPIAWYLATRELREIARGRSPAAGETIAKVAQVLGLVGMLLFCAGLLWMFAMGGMVMLSAWIDQLTH